MAAYPPISSARAGSVLQVGFRYTTTKKIVLHVLMLVFRKESAGPK